MTVNTTKPTSAADEINLNMILSSSKMSRMSDFPAGRDIRLRLGEIKQTNDGFMIGAAVPCALMGETKVLREAWPGVVDIVLAYRSAAVFAD